MREVDGRCRAKIAVLRGDLDLRYHVRTRGERYYERVTRYEDKRSKASHRSARHLIEKEVLCDEGVSRVTGWCQGPNGRTQLEPSKMKTGGSRNSTNTHTANAHNN